jgi:hypothetical protein
MQVMPDAVFVAPLPHVYEFESGASDVVSATNRFGEIAPMNMRSISADGQPARKLFDEGDSLFYACAACSSTQNVHWRIELDAVEENLDLVVISANRDSSNR